MLPAAPRPSIAAASPASKRRTIASSEADSSNSDTQSQSAYAVKRACVRPATAELLPALAPQSPPQRQAVAPQPAAPQPAALWPKPAPQSFTSPKLIGREDPSKNKWLCVCRDPDLLRTKGRAWHNDRCVRHRWATDASVLLVPSSGERVIMLACSGSASAFQGYIWNGRQWQKE